jgi:Holliday junction resolvase-like predicted endonuclease
MPFPLAESYILEAESALGSPLPPRYRAALATSNGGEVETEYDTWQLHPLQDRTDRKRLARTAAHVLRETEQASKWANFPIDVIAIASNGTGDLLVLRRLDNLFEDTVYHWSHESGELVRVAGGIDELATE